MKIKILLCNCKDLCGSFEDSDMNTLPFRVESELNVQCSVLHPWLCEQGGNVVFAAASQPRRYLGVCEALFALRQMGWLAVVGAVLFAGVVGLVGVQPARKAAALHPVEALWG